MARRMIRGDILYRWPSEPTAYGGVVLVCVVRVPLHSFSYICVRATALCLSRHFHNMSAHGTIRIDFYRARVSGCGEVGRTTVWCALPLPTPTRPTRVSFSCHLFSDVCMLVLINRRKRGKQKAREGGGGG